MIMTNNSQLPSLRPDIEIFAGPLDEDGSSTYVIHDPVTGIFNKIGWAEAVVLQRLRHGQTLASLLQEIGEQTTLNASPEEIAALCEDAEKQGLTLNSQVRPAQELTDAVNSKKVNLFKWLVHHYLYFRIPLFHPDAFLTKTLPWARLLAAGPALLIYLFFACTGLYFLSQRFESYFATFTHFFSVKGFIAYSMVIIILKAAHEFGHAFVAKHNGVRVPTMGLAFMVFAPMAYSDVTDAWRLRSRRKRLAIALAGVKVELVIGVFALTLWGLTPPGFLNSICFILSSTTLVSTFLVNLNPAMRFDGYYILSDLWGIDNLSTHTTQFTKWFLRKNLLGFDAPCPVSKAKQPRQLQMVFYSLYAWNYRFFLYLGIAVLVYYKFTKTLGLILFSLEIIMFIIRPIIQEIKMLMKLRSRLKINVKLCLTLTVIILIVGWAVLPLPRTGKAPAVLLPATSQTIYAPKAGLVKEMLVERGDAVSKGNVLARLESESMKSEIECLIISSRQLRHDIEATTMNDERRALVPEIKKQLAAVEEEIVGLQEQQKRFAIKAKISGILVDWDQMLRAGIYLKENQVLGSIASTDTHRIDAFISEKEVSHLFIGQNVKFYPADHTGRITGTVERVDPILEEFVDYLSIGATAAEELPLKPDHSSDKLTLLESYYRVAIAVDCAYPKNVRLGASGTVRYRTFPRSPAWEFLLYCYSILIRESNF